MKLRKFKGRAYLACAYSGGQGCDERARLADIAAAYLIEEFSLYVFSPISQSHRVSRYIDEGNLSHEFWLGQDVGFLQVCDVCYVVADAYYKKSFGVAWEIGWCMANNIPVHYIDMVELGKWAAKKEIEI